MSIDAINSTGIQGFNGANGYLASLFGASRGRGLASLASISAQGFTSSSIRPSSGPEPAPTAFGQRSRLSEAFISTAYQRSRDGDEAFFSSKLGELTAQEQQEISELSARDQEVRTHELAHIAAAGSLTLGGASYDFTTGPDGKRYAVGGSVVIDTTPGQTPQETLAKAQQMRAAALAPSQPSAQDRAIATMASKLEMQAQQELASLASEDVDGVVDPGDSFETGISTAPIDSEDDATDKTGGGSTTPIIDTGDFSDTDDTGDFADETGVIFARGSANSAFNRAEFPGRGNAYGLFKNDKNANAMANAAHGFAFGFDTSATTDPVDGSGDIITDPAEGDSTPLGGGTDASVKDGTGTSDPYAVLTGGELDLVG